MPALAALVIVAHLSKLAHVHRTRHTTFLHAMGSGV
jgi:hypothetical protein